MMKRYFLSLITILFVLVLSFLLFPRDAYAYLNPGTGSLIIQLLVAALIGGTFAIRMAWSKVKGFFKKLFFRGKR